MKIHHLMQDMVVLGLQTEKDREEYRHEVVKSLEATEEYRYQVLRSLEGIERGVNS